MLCEPLAGNNTSPFYITTCRVCPLTEFGRGSPPHIPAHMAVLRRGFVLGLGYGALVQPFLTAYPEGRLHIPETA
jgi:hypothetical protein